jgi:hypothetical protein
LGPEPVHHDRSGDGEQVCAHGRRRSESVVDLANRLVDGRPGHVREAFGDDVSLTFHLGVEDALSSFRCGIRGNSCSASHDQDRALGVVEKVTSDRAETQT